MRCRAPRLFAGAMLIAALAAAPDAADPQSRPECDLRAIRASVERLLIPDFTGCRLEALGGWQAQLALRSERRSSDEVPAGMVIAQSPPPGTELDEIDDGVVLVVSSGPERRIPPVAVADAHAVEGEPLEFEASIERPPDSDETYSYRYAVQVGTARESVDHASAAGELTFGPGVSRRTIRVPTRRNDEAEPVRTVVLIVLAGERPVGRAIGTIVDDAAPPVGPPVRSLDEPLAEPPEPPIGTVESPPRRELDSADAPQPADDGAAARGGLVPVALWLLAIPVLLLAALAVRRWLRRGRALPFPLVECGLNRGTVRALAGPEDEGDSLAVAVGISVERGPVQATEALAGAAMLEELRR